MCSVLYMWLNSYAWANIKYLFYQMFGFIILPMKSICFVMRSLIFSVFYMWFNSKPQANIKCLFHQRFGLIIFPMKSTLSVLRSVIITMNGRLNFKTGIWWKDCLIKPTPVAAAAVAPASSTSRVAWWTTYGIKKDVWDERSKAYR